MSTTVGLHCPVCGAPREPGEARCDYCGSWLLATPAPEFPEDVHEGVVREHIARFRADLAARPDDVVALHGLGVAFRNLGLLDDAIKVLARAANLRPEALGIQRALAGTLHDAVRRQPDDDRMWRDVRRQADRILALDPESAEGWWLRAEVALRTRDHAGLTALTPQLARFDAGGDHAAFADALRDAGDRQFHEWLWPKAVESWAALAVLDQAAGRTALVEFLLQNARLVPRSERPVWRALRRTMALRGVFRQAMFAAVAFGIAFAFIVAAAGVVVTPVWFPAATIVALVVLPLLTWVSARWWLIGWPPFSIPRQPWRDVGTDEIVRVARDIAPRIERVRPGG